MTDEERSKIKKVPLMIALLSGAFVAILNQTLLGTALPYIMRDLEIEADLGQWLQSIFMLVNGIMIPVTAFLIERFTTRGLFLSAMGLFAFGSLLCAIAPSFEILLVGRVFQASGAGIIMPLMQTILFLIFPIDKRGKAMGYFGLIIAFAPAIGPTLSGYLVENHHWSILFYIVLPIAIFDMIVAYFILKNITKQTYPSVHIPSIILSTLGFGGLLYGFSVAGDAGWLATETIISIVVGSITLFFFIRLQLRMETPILQFRIFKFKTFTIATAIGMVSFMSMIGGAIILPIFMQDMLGFSPLESGLMLMPGAILMGLMNPVTGTLFDKFGPRWLLIIGSLGLFLTTLLFTNLDESTSFLYLTVSNTLRMLSIAMIIMPSTTAGLNVLPEKYLPHGTAMNNTFRQISGAVGTALLVSVMTHQITPNAGVAGEINGVVVSFYVAAIISLIGFVLSLFINNRPDHATL